ncbi:MAG TPA: 4Fe-4S dicluster domain-containing protein [Slackia equolifaciens]|uniref:4Fe-4S dicluster domain-containing protein n=1 Tax=Slackia equolifaciens TaxID=498718 RepID=A0A9D2UW95_9ACTN|nr:4Fe-4S dicluster domain-containing protein [Slackia equolifaciens]
MTRYGMAIDLKRCFGCQTCAVACKVANNLPVGLSYNVVYTKTDDDINTMGAAVAKGALSNDCAGGTFDAPKLSFFPMQCQHCESPLCMANCSTGATQQREDGIVWVDYELCIGCGSCVEACPYEGVRTTVTSEPEYYMDVVVGEADAPQHKVNVTEKCNFCYNLIDRGEVPACMQLCPGRARFWGDLDDPESEVSKAIEGRDYEFLHEDAGTKPKVYYLK